MNVESICTRHVVSLDGKETLQRAAMLMREHHVGSVVVTETVAGAARVAGIVTDRDLAIEVLSRGGDASQVPVARLVQGPAVGVLKHADVGDALQAMQSAGVRRLLVHDEQGHLCGLLSIDDLIPALAQPFSGLAEVLRHEMQREVQARGALAAPPRPVLHVPATGTAGWNASTVTSTPRLA